MVLLRRVNVPYLISVILFSVSSELPTGSLSNVPWRRSGVKYANNEVMNMPPAGIYFFKVNNRSTRTNYSGVFIVNVEQISVIFLVSPLLTLIK